MLFSNIINHHNFLQHKPYKFTPEILYELICLIWFKILFLQSQFYTLNSKQFTYKNIKIAYSDSGTGNAIVLLHGYLENRNMWDFYIADLAQNHHVITIDLLGHGKSECLGYIHTMEDQAEMIFALLKELKIKKASFVGHSMGGYIALAFAELNPQNLKSLVLMNSTSLEDSLERKTNRDRAIKMVKNDYVSFVRLSIANLFSEENRNKLTIEIEAVKIEALKTPLQGIIAALEGMKIRKDRQMVLKSLKIPTLLILSKKDPVLNYEDNIKQVDSNMILVTFLDGHMSHIENKVELKAVLLDFFK
jgi:pimeloyl-ACP methyl ester carboxylesterase